jgi:4-oxalocrotonate tautomerase
MPIVHISLLEGRPKEVKEALMEKVVEAITETLQIPKDRVSIILHETKRENVTSAGVPLSKAGH